MKANEQLTDRIWEAFDLGMAGKACDALEVALQAVGDMVPETPEERAEKDAVYAQGKAALLVATSLGLCACGEPATNDLGDCGATYLVCDVCAAKAER